MSINKTDEIDVLYQKGKDIICEYENHIKSEWKNILSQLRLNNHIAATKLEAAINVFSHYIFNKAPKHSKPPHRLQPLQTTSSEISQFTITLLENAVHKVIQEKTDHSYSNHQAVQYLFSKFGEKFLAHPYKNYFSIESFLQNLVTSNQLPIEWAAIVQQDENSFLVEKWFSKTNEDLLQNREPLEADTIFSLSELLLSQIEEEKRRKQQVYPVPHENTTILFSIDKAESAHVIPFITYSLDIFRQGRNVLQITHKEQKWKDSVILFNELILQSQNYHEAIDNIATGFVKFLPFERCALFSYSVDNQMGFGLYGHGLNNKMIQNINEDVSSLPLIQNNQEILRLFGKSIHYLQPIYIANAINAFPDRYIKQFKLRTVVIVPIYELSKSQLLGAAILDQGPNKHFKVSRQTFAALMKFGQSAGQLLKSYILKQDFDLSIQLSPREIEVLKLMAEGASTTEAAESLNLSEYTVRDYISSIMQKMNARNRTEAVARAIREGLIK